ncbi:recombinase family protein [Euzebya rosea]|uniref:recombinase family protein n=1 Tax=Euzebya rosea TaxID=2052804 RepID=UPI000D3E6A2B|nr:recombinase family protein [Euzebya rosea]
MLDAPPRPRLGYARVSTDEQEISIDAQRDRLHAWAVSRGIDDLQIRVDQGHSGKTLKRPAIAEALTELEAAGTGTLVVCKLDRLTRSVVDFAGLMEQSRRQGWHLVALDVGIDTSTPAGELLATIMAALAQWERRQIADRTITALARKAAEGHRLGRPSAIPDDVLARIVGLRGAGRSYQAIADALNADGIPTAGRAARWGKSSVASAVKTARLNDRARARAEEFARRGDDG